MFSHLYILLCLHDICHYLKRPKGVETRVVIKCKTITLSHSGVFTFLYLFSLRWIHYYFGYTFVYTKQEKVVQHEEFTCCVWIDLLFAFFVNLYDVIIKCRSHSEQPSLLSVWPEKEKNLAEDVEYMYFLPVFSSCSAVADRSDER